MLLGLQPVALVASYCADLVLPAALSEFRAIPPLSAWTRLAAALSDVLLSFALLSALVNAQRSCFDGCVAVAAVAAAHAPKARN